MGVYRDQLVPRAVDLALGTWTSCTIPDVARALRDIGAGCSLDRDIAELIAASHLESDDLTNFYMRGPRQVSYIYAGTAAKA